MSRQVDEIQSSGDLARRVGPAGPRDEVGRLAEGFNRLLARLDDAFRSQRRFVSDAAHELRTPLTVARGQIELAPDDPDALAAAVVELDRMGRIVEELLLLARLDEGLPLRREPVEVELVVEEALLRGLRLPAPTGSAGGPGQTWEIAAKNCLSARHTGSSLWARRIRTGRPSTECRRLTITTRRTGAEVVIEVADTGPGIPAAHLPHLFDRFYRGTNRGGGAGLGLAIADSLTQAMSGRIAVRSTVGEGTAFMVHLPAPD